MIFDNLQGPILIYRLCRHPRQDPSFCLWHSVVNGTCSGGSQRLSTAKSWFGTTLGSEMLSELELSRINPRTRSLIEIAVCGDSAKCFHQNMFNLVSTKCPLGRRRLNNMHFGL